MCNDEEEEEDEEKVAGEDGREDGADEEKV
jgi:hypothetical protein